jgi:hypothetical protein
MWNVKGAAVLQARTQLVVGEAGAVAVFVSATDEEAAVAVAIEDEADDPDA